MNQGKNNRRTKQRRVSSALRVWPKRPLKTLQKFVSLSRKALFL